MKEFAQIRGSLATVLRECSQRRKTEERRPCFSREMGKGRGVRMSCWFC